MKNEKLTSRALVVVLLVLVKVDPLRTENTIDPFHVISLARVGPVVAKRPVRHLKVIDDYDFIPDGSVANYGELFAQWVAVPPVRIEIIEGRPVTENQILEKITARSVNRPDI
jgi:hypothetical protein